MMKKFLVSMAMFVSWAVSAHASPPPQRFISELGCGTDSTGRHISLGSVRTLPVGVKFDIQYYLVIAAANAEVQYIPMKWDYMEYPYQLALTYGDTTQYGVQLYYQNVTSDIRQLPIGAEVYIGNQTLQCKP